MTHTKGKIAPAEFCELQLIAEGKKEFAIIEKRKNAAAYFAAGAIRKLGITVQYRESADGAEVIVTTRRQLIAEYDRLIASGISDYGIKTYHRKMGALFGYSSADIEAFISAEINCNCAKCTGLK